MQRAVRIGRTVILRLRRSNVRPGELVIVRLKAPGWKGRTRRFTGSSPALTVHMLLPKRPLTRVTATVVRVGSDGTVFANTRPIHLRRIA